MIKMFSYSLPFTGLHWSEPPLILSMEYCGISRPFIILSILSVIMLTTDDIPSDSVILHWICQRHFSLIIYFNVKALIFIDSVSDISYSYLPSLNVLFVVKLREELDFGDLQDEVLVAQLCRVVLCLAYLLHALQTQWGNCAHFRIVNFELI